MNKHFRAMWDTAGYGSKMGSAEVVPPPPKEFIRVYHLASTEFALSDISLRRLKLARFSDLNDPFELLSANCRERAVRKFLSDFKQSYDSETGLLCFSRDWTNPVLWSHYAAKHRGICLGFDLMRNRFEPVRYKDKRILARLGTGRRPLAMTEAIRKSLLRTKFHHWKYEQEVRVFVPLADAVEEGAMHFHPFDDTLQLVEVILGPQCNLSLTGVRTLVGSLYSGVTTIQARPAFKFFSIVPKESTVPVVVA